MSANRPAALKTRLDELVSLKRLVREFMSAIAGVSFDPLECDQDLVNKLWEQLARQSGYKGE